MSIDYRPNQWIALRFVIFSAIVFRQCFLSAQDSIACTCHFPPTICIITPLSHDLLRPRQFQHSATNITHIFRNFEHLGFFLYNLLSVHISHPSRNTERIWYSNITKVEFRNFTSVYFWGYTKYEGLSIPFYSQPYSHRRIAASQHRSIAISVNQIWDRYLLCVVTSYFFEYITTSVYVFRYFQR